MNKPGIKFWDFAKELARSHVDLNYKEVFRLMTKTLSVTARLLYEVFAMLVIWLHLCLSPILFPIYWLIARRASCRIDKSLEVDDSWGV